MKVDLHCHSTASDGALTPGELVTLAAAQGVELLALTDHDTLAGLPEAQASAAVCGLRLVPGLELSCRWNELEIHVLGLAVTVEDAGLQTLAAANRAARRQRLAAMVERLEPQLGIDGLLEAVLTRSACPGRRHLAEELVQRGVVASVAEAFRRHLGRGRGGYRPADWAPLERAVEVVRAAGGVPVLAHPLAYGLSSGRLRALVAGFVAAGGQALEVITGPMPKDHSQRLLGLALRYGLAASAGSDFHVSDRRCRVPGQCAPLPATVTPVWALFTQGNA